MGQAAADRSSDFSGAGVFKGRLKRRALAFLFFGLTLWGFIAGAVWIWAYAVLPKERTAPEPVTVYIPAQTGFLQIQKILVQAGVIEDDIRFALLARIIRVAHKMKAGEYALAAGQSPYAILKALESGKTVLRPVGFAEGQNIFQVAQLLEQGGWAPQEEFLSLAHDPAFLAELGVAASSLEGYLFPDTYFFERDDSLKEIVTVMVQRMQQVFAEECGKAEAVAGFTFDCTLGANAGRETEKRKRTLGGHELLTLASIVEKETGLPEERPLIAKVFLNRLQRGMKLQADPTVIYGLRKFGAPLSKKDLRTPTPFNTYTMRGLPQGPIANPGRAAIAAVFHPAPEGYYYFVSENNGGHYFSKTLQEHNRAVARFRKKERSKAD